MDVVELDKVIKELRTMPVHIRRKLIGWAKAVELKGLQNVRKMSGYHDEPLLGSRRGQRSVRLSWSYRAIYILNKNEEQNIVSVIKVSRHDY